MINWSALITGLPLEDSKVDQICKFYDFLDLSQFFQIWSDIVLIEMNDDVINNFELHDQLSRIHSFHS